MEADFVVKNGKVVTPHGTVIGGVAVLGEKIAAVAPDAVLPQAREVYDAGGNFILPGVIDPHVHLCSDEPGTPIERYADDLMTESRGAVYGGVTCFLTRIASLQSVKELFDQVVNWGEANSYCDFILNAAVFAPVHLEEQEWLCERGVAAFKHFFIAYKGPEGIQKGLQPVNAGVLFQSFENIARVGFPAIGLVHPEEMDIIDVLKERLQKSGRKDLGAWTEARPAFTELMQIEAAALIAEATGARFYIPHLTIGRGVETVERFLDRGVNIYAETCPHYLILHKDMSELEGWGKVVPPLRTQADQEALWTGLRRGIVLNIGSDHCPYSRASKEQRAGKGNLWTAMPGFNNGMEHLLPLMWTHGVHRGRISVEQFAKICSENSARIFGIYPRKGALLPGSDADIIIVDPNMEAVIDESFYHTRSPEWSVFYGHKVRGLCTLTMVRGKVVMRDRKATDDHGHGRFIPMSKY